MKKIHLFKLMICILLAFCSLTGCFKSKSSEPVSSGQAEILTPQPHTVTKSENATEVIYGNSPHLEVVASATYIFPKLKGNELYASCEYKNTSDCPCVVKAVNYEINLSEKKVEIESAQPAAKYCVIYPGETMYHAAWKAYDCKESDTVQIVNVSIECEKTDAKRLAFEITDLYVVQNYPQFSTVSGTIKGADENASLNEIYLGLYNAKGDFIGTWYFTDPSEIAANSEKHFTTHLKALPIENIADDIAKVTAFGFGFNI